MMPLAKLLKVLRQSRDDAKRELDKLKADSSLSKKDWVVPGQLLDNAEYELKRHEEWYEDGAVKEHKRIVAALKRWEGAMRRGEAETSLELSDFLAQLVGDNEEDFEVLVERCQNRRWGKPITRIFARPFCVLTAKVCRPGDIHDKYPPPVAPDLTVEDLQRTAEEDEDGGEL
eukprot:Hpha_TRINITY_DN35555_c0_g1::TRINITY_DN35555_c0_g1_i1::g.84465::m.84465